MTTLKRKLNLRFGEVLHGFKFAHEISEQTVSDLIEQLSTAALEAFYDKPKIDFAKSDPAWAVLAGKDVDGEEMEKKVAAKEARDAFERDLHFNPLPWYSNLSWEKLAQFVEREYKKDKLVFFKYDSWRKDKGKFAGALNNKNIMQTPTAFITCFPDFLAHTAMYPKQVEQRPVEIDDNGAPISYG
jgi:hypothetical protein